MLLMKRKCRTRLDLLKPSVRCHVENKQNSFSERTVSRHLRQLQRGDKDGKKLWYRGQMAAWENI